MCEAYRGHIWVRSSLRSRGTFLSHDHTPQRPHSCTLVHNRHRRCPVHTLRRHMRGGGVSTAAVVVLISLDWTHICGSERRGIPRDTCTGRLPGDRRLRLRSHTGAGRRDRRGQEGRLGMTEQRISRVGLRQELSPKTHFVYTHSAHTDVRSDQQRSDTSPSLCHRCCCSDSRT